MERVASAEEKLSEQQAQFVSKNEESLANTKNQMVREIKESYDSLVASLQTKVLLLGGAAIVASIVAVVCAFAK